MDWTTIRVFTKNLEELIGQYERGEHEGDKNHYGSKELSDTWWIGIRSVSASLAIALNVSPDDVQSIEHSDHWTRTKRMTKYAGALVSVAKRLLAEMDAARPAPSDAEAATAAAP